MAERRIREAHDNGEFDDLPGTGSPLPGLNRPYRQDWWARSYVERDRNRQRASKAWARADRILGRLWAVEDETVVSRTVDTLNAHLDRVNQDLPEEDRVPLLDRAELLDTWRRMSKTLRHR